jgi:hypothetical protein
MPKGWVENGNPLPRRVPDARLRQVDDDEGSAASDDRIAAGTPWPNARERNPARAQRECQALRVLCEPDMRFRSVLVSLGSVLLATSLGCSQGSGGGSVPGTTSAPLANACTSGQPLAGAAYDVTQSKFAFGSAPVAVDAGSLTRWTGREGVVAIFSDGSEMAILDATSTASGLPGWSGDPVAKVTGYYEGMGVPPCEIAGTSETSSAGGGGSTAGAANGGAPSIVTVGQTSVGLDRAVDGIPVVESAAWATFDENGETTYEAFYWPEIPAEVVSAARAFQDQLAGGLAAFKAKLPADAQGDGRVVIHHHVAGAPGAFTAVAVYDTVQTTSDFSGEELYFDPNGNPVSDTWSGD